MLKEKKKKNFSDIFKKYKHYNPSVEGYGNTNEWQSAFEAMNPEEARKTLHSADPLSVLNSFLEIKVVLFTINELKAAYRKLVMIHHPDKGGNEENFKKIQAAYSILLEKL